MSETQLVNPGESSILAVDLSIVNDLRVMTERHAAVTKFIQEGLEDGRDYGVIAGTDRHTLFKAGAEKLLIAFNCTTQIEFISSISDPFAEVPYLVKKWFKAEKPKDQAKVDEMKAAGTGRFKKNNASWDWQESEKEESIAYGHYEYTIEAKVILRSSGEIVGSGVGSASTMESKYIRNPRDAQNTVLKMAKKRAIVDATLSTFALSDRFTQDVEDTVDTAKKENKESPEESYWRIHEAISAPRYDRDTKELICSVWAKYLKRDVADASDVKDSEWPTLISALIRIQEGKGAMPKAWLHQ